jgi:ribosomal-protein-alanine N-acetyltransferase
MKPVGDTPSLRPATPGDVEALVDIDAASPGAWPAERFARIIAGKMGTQAVLVVHRDGEVDGFIAYSRVLDEISIHNIAVCASRRGRGVGSRLLAGLLEWVKPVGVSRCLLEVRESNTAARRLYEKMGFTLDGERRNYYPGPGAREHALLLSRSL